MVKGSGRCIFCGKGPTSGEDILPKWLRKMIPYDHKAKIDVQVDTAHLIEDKFQAGAPRPMNPLRIRKYIACRKCNNGWMERDRDVVMRLIKGEQVSLLREDQLGLSRWAVKTAMTYEFCDYNYPPVIWPSFRRRLYDNMTPPPGSCVLIASTSPEGPELWAAVGGQASGPGDEPPPWFAMSCHFGLGQLQLFVLISNMTHRGGKTWTDFPPGRDGKVPVGIRQVWPTIEPVDFPISSSISKDDAEVVGNVSIPFMQRLGMYEEKLPPVIVNAFSEDCPGTNQRASVARCGTTDSLSAWHGRRERITTGGA